VKLLCLVVCLVLAAGSAAFAQLVGTNPLVRFHTDLGDMDVYLVQDIAPITVTNFLKYVNRGDYNNTFIHRSAPMFVIQGGGYTFVNGQPVAIRQDAAIQNEFHISNTRGTLAMAKPAGNPNSATNQWFFNESDSNASGPNGLDTQNGGFTVFGRLMNSASLTTMDTIAAVSIHPTCPFASPFDQLPLLNYTCGNMVVDSNLVHVIWIKVMPQIVAITHPSANTIHIQGRGVNSTTYTLQKSTTPDASGFTTSVNVSTGTAGNLNYDDVNPGTKRFYRLAISVP
jgi:cyclophilin family peptidyl-prolyl cis-trans isomerase